MHQLRGLLLLTALFAIAGVGACADEKDDDGNDSDGSGSSGDGDSGDGDSGDGDSGDGDSGDGDSGDGDSGDGDSGDGDSGDGDGDSGSGEDPSADDGYDSGSGKQSFTSVTCQSNGSDGYIGSATDADGHTLAFTLPGVDRPTAGATYTLIWNAIGLPADKATISHNDGVGWYSQDGTMTTEVSGDYLTIVLQDVTLHNHPTQPGDTKQLSARITCPKERIGEFTITGKDTCRSAWADCIDGGGTWATGTSGCNPGYTLTVMFGPDTPTPGTFDVVAEHPNALVDTEVRVGVVGGPTGTDSFGGQSGTVEVTQPADDEMKVSFTDVPIKDGDDADVGTVSGTLYCRP